LRRKNLPPAKKTRDKTIKKKPRKVKSPAADGQRFRPSAAATLTVPLVQPAGQPVPFTIGSHSKVHLGDPKAPHEAELQAASRSLVLVHGVEWVTNSELAGFSAGLQQEIANQASMTKVQVCEALWSDVVERPERLLIAGFHAALGDYPGAIQLVVR